MTACENTRSVWRYLSSLRSPPGQKGTAQTRKSSVSEDPIREGRNGCGSVWRRVRTVSSQRARRSASSFRRREAFSTTLRANGKQAEGSETESWTRNTVPIAPLPSTLIARRLSRSISGEEDDVVSIWGGREREKMIVEGMWIWRERERER